MKHHIFMSEAEKKNECRELILSAYLVYPGLSFTKSDIKEGAELLYNYIYGKDEK
jgi:hypothetical protein